MDHPTRPSPEVPTALSDDDAGELLRRAREARALAHAPYSGFPVGAALLARDGRIFTGVNVENASHSLATCAERGAVAAAFAAGARGFTAVAVAGPDDGIPCPPCGACRQILHEADADLLVVTSGAAGTPRVTPLATLLPEAFDSRVLRARRPP